MRVWLVQHLFLRHKAPTLEGSIIVFTVPRRIRQHNQKMFWALNTSNKCKCREFKEKPCGRKMTGKLNSDEMTTPPPRPSSPVRGRLDLRRTQELKFIQTQPTYTSPHFNFLPAMLIFVPPCALRVVMIAFQQVLLFVHLNWQQLRRNGWNWNGGKGETFGHFFPFLCLLGVFASTILDPGISGPWLFFKFCFMAMPVFVHLPSSVLWMQ